ncbi:aminodeoxychorismate lyase [Arthrobacter jiangjiafuii]|uniref:Aminodeoxychorismate lyase n=1 Tax=Arthrobacter jiangjiafuii TaxID=2817475 RepID=A0A975R031_9MICC|nr:aminodeoxychorismate lyase [Arthrobacter jiangjiafuii]MBP3042490.1 aminodeoxychorismate lyase [Arthrobacter jiangjiafuii]QWC09767.1 aminodeoxychorismate lyase [Arthrobacter jiangjiafuii]
MTVLVFLDPRHPEGRIADAAAPALLATDLGATRGDGVFESMLAVGGQPRKMGAHLDRLAASAHTLELDSPDRGAWERAVATALSEHLLRAGTGEAVVKLLLTRGAEGSDAPTAWVSVSPVPAGARERSSQGLAVVLLDRGYDSTLAERAPWLLLGAKTLSYAVNMAALRYAKANGADDAIFTSSDGKVLEGPTSTVILAVEEDGVKTLLTPELESGILPGTTQRALFDAAEAAGWALGYGPLEPVHLMEADAVWLVSSIRLLAPVTSIDGTPISSSPALTEELTALLHEAL